MDPSEFYDGDYQATRTTSPGAAGAPGAAPATRPPTRAEVESKVTDVQQELARLKRSQEELERQRAALEETRRRQMEWQNGRQELIQGLTRGLGLLEEAEFAARRDAEQMAKNVAALKDAVTKIQAIREECWTQENFEVELTRALTTLENARQEWNSSQLKFPFLTNGTKYTPPEPGQGAANPFEQERAAARNFPELCRTGLALTWPVAVMLLLILIVLLVRH